MKLLDSQDGNDYPSGSGDGSKVGSSTSIDSNKFKIKQEIKMERNSVKNEPIPDKSGCGTSKMYSISKKDENESDNLKGNENVDFYDDNHDVKINLKNKFKIKKEDIDIDKDDEIDNDDAASVKIGKTLEYEKKQKGHNSKEEKSTSLDKLKVLNKSDDSHHQRDDTRKKYGNSDSPVTNVEKDKKSRKHKHSDRDKINEDKDATSSDDKESKNISKKKKIESSNKKHENSAGDSSDISNSSKVKVPTKGDTRMKIDPIKSKKKIKHLFYDNSSDENSDSNREGDEGDNDVNRKIVCTSAGSSKRRNDSDAKSSEYKSKKLLINQDLSKNDDDAEKTAETGRSTKKRRQNEKPSQAVPQHHDIKNKDKCNKSDYINDNSSHHDTDDDGYKHDENEKIEKRHSNNNIFRGVSLYVPNDVNDMIKEEMMKFIELGGNVLNDTRKCTHVLHKDKFIADDIFVLR